MKKSVLVLFGGVSSEHYISINSGYTILENMDKTKYDIIPVGITLEGKWRYIHDFESLKTPHWQDNKNSTPCTFSIEDGRGFIFMADMKFDIDVVFPMLHGPFGEDGTVQGLFELLNIPIVGPKTLSAALCMDKDKSHKIVKSLGYEVPHGILLTNKEDFILKMEDLKNLKFPVFVKPLKGGSSIGISEVEKFFDLENAVSFAFNYDDKILIEEKIEGFEVFCGIMGNEELIVGDLEEIELLDNTFLNADRKNTLEQVKYHIPARLDTITSEKIKSMAKDIYNSLDCRVYSRVDMFVGNDGILYFNEVNTTPGFTITSAFPMMMKSIGIEIKDLISILIELAL
ncbi:MAG: D-alanine--D-alanine ligase family protein [Neofamilia sp.]